MDVTYPTHRGKGSPFVDFLENTALEPRKIVKADCLMFVCDCVLKCCRVGPAGLFAGTPY